MTRVITDKKELYKLIAFLVMGDGGVYKQTDTGNARFVMVQREDHLDFLGYAQEILDNSVGTRIKHVDRSMETDMRRANQYRLESKTHPIMTQMRDRIYVGNYKSLDPHYLKALDYESLAILYMSDGSLSEQMRHGSVNPSHSIRLCLKRLSYGDLWLLKKALRDNLGLEWNVNKCGKYFELRLRTKDVAAFVAGISQYIVPSYRYKLPELKSCGLPLSDQGDDIVCSLQECKEPSRDDLAAA
ncbi:hypothetical protein Dxin01_00159 [Deinococcus xinjiangensis]|uniref:Homing endonuclease LAGLIDADG domain-containing protein n=1 Tax=Deinococcus xinjiangensis TaxID=457454 RepID=A0ABP9VAZ3_9DEIO